VHVRRTPGSAPGSCACSRIPDRERSVQLPAASARGLLPAEFGITVLRTGPSPEMTLHSPCQGFNRAEAWKSGLTFPGLRDLTAAVRLLLIVAGLSGCLAPAGEHTAATNAPAGASKLIVTADSGLSGTVSWVNADWRFVVLTFPVGQMPALEQRLSVYRRGLKVGELKVSGPQQDDSIVADITAGEAARGDTVSDR
jgi:hypothetical protein